MRKQKFSSSPKTLPKFYWIRATKVFGPRTCKSKQSWLRTTYQGLQLVISDALPSLRRIWRCSVSLRHFSSVSQSFVLHSHREVLKISCVRSVRSRACKTVRFIRFRFLDRKSYDYYGKLKHQSKQYCDVLKKLYPFDPCPLLLTPMGCDANFCDVWMHTFEESGQGGMCRLLTLAFIVN